MTSPGSLPDGNSDNPLFSFENSVFEYTLQITHTVVAFSEDFFNPLPANKKYLLLWVSHDPVRKIELFKGFCTVHILKDGTDLQILPLMTSLPFYIYILHIIVPAFFFFGICDIADRSGFAWGLMLPFAKTPHRDASWACCSLIFLTACRQCIYYFFQTKVLALLNWWKVYFGRLLAA